MLAVARCRQNPKVRFQADADFDRCIVQATLRREVDIDLQLAPAARGGAGLRGLSEPEHFATFRALESGPGVIIVPQRMPIRS